MSRLRQSISAISFPVSLVRTLIRRKTREIEWPRIRRGEEKKRREIWSASLDGRDL